MYFSKLYSRLKLFKSDIDNFNYGKYDLIISNPPYIDENEYREFLKDKQSQIVGELSGGQRQRVAMGRAIVRNPKVFLFDEPLSNLDAKMRGQMRIEIKRVHQHLKTTTIYVTHDQVEACLLYTSPSPRD